MATRLPDSALIVTQYYWPELIGSGPYCTDLARRLGERGVATTVLTCRPHYPEGTVSSSYCSGTRDSETRDGVAIERLAPWRPDRRGTTGRLMTESMFVARSLFALLRRRVHRADLVLCLCPSVLAMAVATVATRSGGRRVALVHDIQSGLAAGLDMTRSGLLIRLMRWAERVLLDRADVVIVLTESMARHLREIGVTRPIEILPIWVDGERIKPLPAAARDITIAQYSGNLGRKQGLDQLLDMADILAREQPAIRVVLRGEGNRAEPLRDEVKARKLANVEIAPLVPADRYSESLAEGDIHLVPQNERIADFAIPSKVFAIMAAARPFVATARPDSHLWQLRDASQAFLCVPAGDAQALADAVGQLAADPERRATLGRNGRRFVLERHDRSVVLDRFLDLVRHSERSSSWHPSAAPTS